jgi:hypothetical protein
LDILTKLTHEQYLSTFTPAMANVTETAEPVIDIWPSVNQLVKKKILPAVVVERYLVEAVYRDLTGTYDHIILPTGQAERVISLIVDIPKKRIFGYYVLDLAKQYGLG